MFPQITHNAQLFVHTLKGTYPHLYGLWYYKPVKVFIIPICNKMFQRKAYSKELLVKQWFDTIVKTKK